MLDRIGVREKATIMGKLFGTDGIRGKALEYPVTEAMARKLGVGLVSIFGSEGKFLVGRDTRESGALLEAAFVEGVCDAGAGVVRLGVVPTPAVALLVKELGATAAVMLTASHNPWEDNGMKIFGGDGFKLEDALEEKVEEFLLDESEAGSRGGGMVEDFPGGAEVYVAHAKASVGGMDFSGMKVVLDAGNGAGWEVGAKIFRELGAEVVTMAVKPDGRNINEGCGALHADAAGRLVVETGADLGISLDGDADRVIFTDGNGKVVAGDRALAVCALSLKSGGGLPGGAMVATVMSNLGLDEAMAAEGISVIRTGVGDRLVLERMRKEGIVFGGENSGHLIFAEHATTGDGILSALQVCKMMKGSGKKLEELADVMCEYPSELVNLKTSKKPDLKSLPKLQALIAEADVCFGKEGRQLIRYSGTENKIRVLVEHKEEAVVNEWVEKFKNVIGEEIG
ncbi:MAG: phosphoglucosamine mutase [Luteolibacter sp.]